MIYDNNWKCERDTLNRKAKERGWSQRYLYKNKNQCSNCGKLITNSATRCKYCSNEYNKNLEIFKRDCKNKVVLDGNLKQVIIGTVLGDGCIRNTTKRGNAYLTVTHCAKQKEYLLWKYQILKKVIGINKRTTKEGEYLTIDTKSNKIFNYYHKLFYQNGRKIVTKEILNMLEPLGLAVWYMDDGSYNYIGKNAILYSCAFSYEENNLIKDRISQFKINPTVSLMKVKYKGEVKKYHKLVFNMKETRKFISLIKPFILKSMYYKLGLDNKKVEKAIKHKIKYFERNRLHFQEYRKEYYTNNALKIKFDRRMYYKLNKQKTLAKNRQWRIKNKEYVKNRRRLYYLNTGK
jgi:hypothetical protein|tara:strand:+ start:24 stop:1067 length:1044 start_codon:yes stop_codon:yes gene_type:complete